MDSELKNSGLAEPRLKTNCKAARRHRYVRYVAVKASGWSTSCKNCRACLQLSWARPSWPRQVTSDVPEISWWQGKLMEIAIQLLLGFVVVDHSCHMHISQTLALPRISCPGADGTVVSDDARQEIAGFQKVEKKQSTRPATCFITCIDRNVEAGLRHSRPAKPKRRSSKPGSRSELLVYWVYKETTSPNTSE